MNRTTQTPRPSWSLLTGALILLLTASAGLAFDLAAYSFDQGAEGWMDFAQPDAPMTLDPQIAHSGSALKSTYTLSAATPFHGLGVMLPGGIAGARSLRFWLRTDHRALLYVGVQEDEAQWGGRYGTVLYTLPNQWHEVELSLDRLREADDTTDLNGQLDLDQVTSLFVTDVSHFLGLAGLVAAPRTIWLDEFTVLTDEVPSAYSVTGELPYMIDSFDTDLIGWIPFIGEVELDRDLGQLRWTYAPDDPPNAVGIALPALMHNLGPLPAEGASELLITIASERAAKLIIALQEDKRDGRDESAYQLLLDVPAGTEPRTFSLPLADFQLDPNGDNGTDENGQLDLDQVVVIAIVDVESVLGLAADNTLTVEEIQLLGEPENAVADGR